MSDEPVTNAPLSAEEQDQPAEERMPDEEGQQEAPPAGSGDEAGEE